MGITLQQENPMKSDKINKATRLLEGAYAIRTAADNIKYYRDFADIYDRDFADQMGYIYPAMLAKVYMQHRNTSDTPIADIGCGTGLVADALHELNARQSQPDKLEIDGVDISTEMLDTARQKSLYRTLHQADLTQDFSQLPDNFGAIVSAGTFTFGHLGPAILPELLALGRSDTLYCIGVNSIHFEEQGFSKTLDDMVDDKLISQPVTEIRKIYKSKIPDDKSHADDTATVLVYRQL